MKILSDHSRCGGEGEHCYLQRGEHYPTKQLYSAVAKTSQLALKIKKKEKWKEKKKKNPLTNCSLHHSIRHMQLATPPLWKNNPPELGGNTPSGPYGGGPYKELGTQLKARDDTMPTLQSTEVSSVPHGPALCRGASRRCAFSSKICQGKGGPDTFGVLQ